MANYSITCAIKFGDNTRKLKLKGTSLAALVDHLKSDDSLKDFVKDGLIYQIHDEYLNMMVNIDDQTILTDKTIIYVANLEKSTLKDVCPSKRATLKETDTVTPDDDLMDNVTTEASSSGNGNDFYGVIQDKREEVHPKLSRATFSLTFRLPNFPDYITNPELYNANSKEGKKRLSREITSMLFNSIRQDYGYYSNNHLFVAQKLVQTYPHLKCTPGAGYETWWNQLKVKFKNYRATVKGVKEIEAARLLFGSKKPQKEEIPKEVARFEIEDCFEDEFSILAHQKLMADELNKSNKDMAAINSRMDRTFSSRSKLIREKSSVQDILDNYPALGYIDQIHLEFERITKVNAKEKIMDALIKCGESIWNACPKPGTAALKSNIMEIVISENDKDYQNRLKCIYSLILVPRFFKDEKAQMMFEQQVKEDKTPGPIIKFSGHSMLNSQHYEIHVDGVKVSETDEFESAIIAYFESFWIFNIQYSDKVFKTLTFIEVGLLGLKYTPLKTQVKNVLKRLQLLNG